ncbi:hypothetical protein KBB12_04110, partial [Candidatus Woesebacteria bacterium]|nr:hypothetical protein [Candidatus Woesebacteria bacterium]
MSISSVRLRKSTLVSILIILIGFIFLMLPVIPHGWLHECASGKCGIFFADMYRARDDLWQMSLAKVAFDTFPLRMPIYAGATLQNYHFLYSALLGIVASLSVPVNFGYYVILPISWFIAYTFFTIQIAKKLTKDRRAIPFFLFFSYFSSGLTYLLSLKNTGLFLHNIGWFSNQPGEYMINPTLALSLIFFQLLILILLSGIRNKKMTFALILITFFMWGSKFYGGAIGTFLVGFYLLSLALEKTIQPRRLIVLLVGVGLVSIFAIFVFYNPLDSIGKGGVFSLEPFKTIHPMIEDPELFPLPRIARLRYIISENPFIFWPYLMLIESATVVLYVIFAYGTRLLSVGYVFTKEKLSPMI